MMCVAWMCVRLCVRVLSTPAANLYNFPCSLWLALTLSTSEGYTLMCELWPVHSALKGTCSFLMEQRHRDRETSCLFFFFLTHSHKHTSVSVPLKPQTRMQLLISCTPVKHNAIFSSGFVCCSSNISDLTMRSFILELLSHIIIFSLFVFLRKSACLSCPFPCNHVFDLC